MTSAVPFRRYCAAANCDAKEPDHLFGWPKHKSSTDDQRTRWTQFVTLRVSNFDYNSRSRLCFRHFDPSCFTNWNMYKMMTTESVRLTMRRDSDVVPTINVKADELIESPRKEQASTSAHPLSERRKLIRGMTKPITTSTMESQNRSTDSIVPASEAASHCDQVMSAALRSRPVVRLHRMKMDLYSTNIIPPACIKDEPVDVLDNHIQIHQGHDIVPHTDMSSVDLKPTDVEIEACIKDEPVDVLDNHIQILGHDIALHSDMSSVDLKPTDVEIEVPLQNHIHTLSWEIVDADKSWSPPYSLWRQMITHRSVSGPLSTGCKLWTGAKSKTRGYGRMNIGWGCEASPSYRRRVVEVHRLLLMAKHKSIKLAKGYHCSHLCHVKLCVRESHLSLEPGHVTASRRSCADVRTEGCIGHDPYPPCISNASVFNGF